MLHIPAAVIEPRPWVRQALRLLPAKIAHRPLQTNGRWVERADRGEPSVLAFERDDPDAERRLVEERHADGAAVAPEAQKCQMALGQLFAREGPCARRHDRARPGTMRLDPAAFLEDFNER